MRRASYSSTLLTCTLFDLRQLLMVANLARGYVGSNWLVSSTSVTVGIHMFNCRASNYVIAHFDLPPCTVQAINEVKKSC